MPWERSADGSHGFIGFEEVDGARPGERQACTHLKTMPKVGKVAVERPAEAFVGFVAFEGGTGRA